MSGFHIALRRISACLMMVFHSATGRPSEFWPAAAALAAVILHLTGFLSGSPPPPAAAAETFPAFPTPQAEPEPLLTVSVTGYSSTPDQTDDTPFLTASNTRVRAGIVALSRDLLREYTPGARFGFGDLIEIAGAGIFHVEDTMNGRFHHRVDIWFPTRGEASRWGKRRLAMRRLETLEDTELAWRAPRSPVDLPPGALFQPAVTE